MSELIKLLGIELHDISLFLLLTTAICFILICLISRLLGGILAIRHHQRLVWAIDLVLLPLAIFLLDLLAARFISPESEGLIRSFDLVSAALLWLVGAWLMTRGLELFVWTSLFINLTGAECPRLLRTLVAGAIYVLALYGILTFVFKHPVTGLLVSTGIIAGVLGLSLQSVLSDLFAGLAITIERPYKIGDWIELKDGTIGQVMDINWRSTRLLSFNNSLFIVPNDHIVNSVIHNFDLPQKLYSTWFYLSVASDASPRLVQQLLMEAALNCKSVIKDPLPIVRLSDATGQPYKYMVWIYFREYITHWGGLSDLYETILSHLAKSGISPAAVKYEIASREAPMLDIKAPNISEYLRGIEIFQPLSDAEVEQMAAFCEIKDFREGTPIIHEGDEGSSLFVIVSGMVSILKKDDKDQEIELARLANGNVVGEISLLTGEPRMATVQAITPLTVVEVPKKSLEPLLKAKPQLGNQLAVIMAKRRFQTKELMESRGVQHASELMLAYAKEMVKKIRAFFSLR